MAFSRFVCLACLSGSLLLAAMWRPAAGQNSAPAAEPAVPNAATQSADGEPLPPSRSASRPQDDLTAWRIKLLTDYSLDQYGNRLKSQDWIARSMAEWCGGRSFRVRLDERYNQDRVRWNENPCNLIVAEVVASIVPPAYQDRV